MQKRKPKGEGDIIGPLLITVMIVVLIVITLPK